MEFITIAKLTDSKEATRLFRKYTRIYRNTDICIALTAYNTIIGISSSAKVISKVLVIEHIPSLDCTINQQDFLNKLENMTKSE